MADRLDLVIERAQRAISRAKNLTALARAGVSVPAAAQGDAATPENHSVGLVEALLQPRDSFFAVEEALTQGSLALEGAVRAGEVAHADADYDAVAAAQRLRDFLNLQIEASQGELMPVRTHAPVRLMRP